MLLFFCLVVDYSSKFGSIDYRVLRLSYLYRYNAVFGTSFEQENVKDAKLPDKAGFVLDMDVQLDKNPASLKMEKLAHVSPQFLYSQFLTTYGD